MTTVNPFAAPQMPLSQVMDGGTGGGAAGAAGSSGQGGSQGGSPAGGGPAISPVSLADDTPISHEGKTLTWKQYRESNFAPKSELDNVRNQTKAEFTANLRKLAAQIQQQQQQHRQQSQPRVDPLAGVRDLPIVDGKTLASLYEQGLGPIAQAIQLLQKQNSTLGNELKQLKGGFGTIAKERNSQERSSRVTQAISSLGEGFDPKDDFLKDLALDLMDAWEFEKPEEFPAMLKDRVERSLKFAKAYQKAQLEASKKRIFTRPGGNASPNGPARPNQRLAPQQLADALFGTASRT